MPASTGKRAKRVDFIKAVKSSELQWCQMIGLDKSLRCLAAMRIVLKGASSKKLMSELAGPLKMSLTCPRCGAVMRMIPQCSKSDAAGPSC